MPFQRLLNTIRETRGVEAAAFLDSEGELILYSGSDADRMRVLGAYQGLLLSTAERLGFPGVRAAFTQCEKRCVLTKALKDGYFISVVFSPDLNFAYAQFAFQEIYRELENAL